MARAIKGDYKIPNGLRELDSEQMKEYTFIGNFSNYEMYRINKPEDMGYQYDYIIGYFEDNIFKKIAKIYFNKINDYYEVDTIYVSEDLRGNGIASKLYTYFVKELGYTILGSDMQRFGARKLWSKLSKCEDLNVSILDFNTREIIDSNVRIYHGDLDEEFDERVWSYVLIRNILG